MRYGKNKRLFYLYKFRTLRPDAEKKLHSRVVNCKDLRELASTWGGSLRRSKLDELPQLFNVLKGDMVFIGPRAQRPIIYENIRQHIPGYTRRLHVMPGLVAYPQIYLAHSAPKRIQYFFDQLLIRELLQREEGPRPVRGYALLLLQGIFHAGCQIAAINGNMLLHRLGALRRPFAPQRMFRRVRQDNCRLTLHSSGRDQACSGTLLDISQESFSFLSHDTIPAGWYEFRLHLQRARLLHDNSFRGKTARLQGHLNRGERTENDGLRYVVRFQGASPLQNYIIHQYFLRRGLLQPPARNDRGKGDVTPRHAERVLRGSI